ncbi:hypothetical protein [Methylocystis parvus]|uniref:hypothetical protein n=1 Tax=Methylocystis parvus TaxID=134 RepID=UPI0002FE7343|nr:hypothetical protein [Methylocystis parvus]WBK02534.1 hypothetical protein MMG94_21055 [Methylocystis parvus OBBP]
MDEIVFLHRPLRTAIFADLIEALTDDFLDAHWPWWLRLLARLDGITSGNPGAPRGWRITFVNRGAARSARDKVLSWDFEQAVVAHGDWPRVHARDSVRRALAWV